jgi:hypothetical protein
MTITGYEILFWVLLIIAFFFYLRHNDEMLFLPVLFFFFTGIERYNAVAEGKSNWVRVAYTRDIFTPITEEKVMMAMFLFALGTVIFFFSYRFFAKKVAWPEYARDTDEIFSNFIQDKKGLILGFFIFYSILFTATRGLIGGAVALGQSYFLLLPMALGGFILLAFLVYRSYSWGENTAVKLFYLGLMIYAIIQSYHPGQRFQFLSWMVAIGIIVTKAYTPVKKIKYYVAGGILVLFFFSLAGVKRHTNIKHLTFQERWELASARTDSREDQNMLDGMMMVLDVYPENLNYHYGGEHFEILLRPIPRGIWPGKPVGGYANKLGLNVVEKGTIGISQTIYGTFYGEGGIWGIVIFSILYGFIFVKLFRYAGRYNSDLYWLLKGVIIASFVPILRGGDLPGIIAFIGMSYWPIFLLVFLYNRHLRKLESLEAETDEV